MVNVLSWVHTQAGIGASFAWENEGVDVVVDCTRVLGTLPGTETYVVHVQATADSGYGYSYPTDRFLTVRMGENDMPIIDNATEQEIAQF